MTRKFISLLIVMLLLSACGGPAVETFLPVQPPTEPPPKTLSFLAAGDNLIHRPIYIEAKEKNEDYDFTHTYALIKKYVDEADIAFINQETPLGGEVLGLSAYPQFNSPKQLGRDLAKIGFDVVNHANNHIIDKGEIGMKNTIDFWKTQPQVTMIGAYESAEDAKRIRVVTRNDIRLAFLTYTYGTNGLSLPKGSHFVVPYIDTELIKRQIEEAKGISDAVIVVMHWGNENQTTPSQEQKSLAKLIADSGADLILGMHPHVIQPIEYIGDTLVVYSLGNFISNQASSDNMLGGMVRIVFEKINYNTKIKSAKFIPVVTHFNRMYRDNTVYPLDMYTEELASQNGVLNRDSRFTLSYIQNLLKRVIPPEFL
ncbi:MAG: Capsule biosynthesis protein CapA [Firmicutes bacterium ADurb.Bin193]|nr:MAG: Capsule biosynthesis protein CapA [Firmicutes bacterium ADurb.Bin193]